MRNQPKYNFFKNTSYALKGLVDLIKTETSFKIELVIVLVLLPILYLIDTSLSNKLLMFITLIGMLLAETINSAIERVVDLVTLEYHQMAGRAKDVGSSMLGDAYWKFVVKVSSTNGNEFTVSTKKEYSSSYLAYTACNNMGSTFSSSVKQLISDIINHPKFVTLVK